MPLPRPHVVPAEDSELDILPPLESDETESAENEDHELDDLADNDDPLDDKTGEDDEIEPEDFGKPESNIVGDDSEGFKADPDAFAVLENADAISFVDVESSEKQEEGLVNLGEDFGIDEKAFATVERDGGEEGPTDKTEDVRAEDLPPLDADEEEEIGDEAFFDRNYESRGEMGLVWAEQPWELVFAHATDSPVTALAASDGGAFVFTKKLSFVNDAGEAGEVGARDLPPRVTSLSTSNSVLDAIVADGRVLRSTDNGATFAALDEIRSTLSLTTLTMNRGELVPNFDAKTGRSLLSLKTKEHTVVVADLSNDADDDGEDVRVVVLSIHANRVWVGTAWGILVYQFV